MSNLPLRSVPSPRAGVGDRRRRTSGLAAATAVAALLAACGTTPPTSPAPPVVVRPTTPAPAKRLPELAAFSARLSGQAMVPPTDSAGQGELVAVLNRNTGLLQWKLNFAQLTGPVRSAQFHSPAMSGEVAAPVMRIGRNVISPYEGRAMLTPKQRADLVAGQWYVVLRTARYPDGEVRGQLIEQH